jgi:hypothetical protein
MISIVLRHDFETPKVFKSVLIVLINVICEYAQFVSGIVRQSGRYRTQVPPSHAL